MGSSLPMMPHAAVVMPMSPLMSLPVSPFMVVSLPMSPFMVVNPLPMSPTLFKVVMLSSAMILKTGPSANSPPGLKPWPSHSFRSSSAGALHSSIGYFWQYW